MIKIYKFYANKLKPIDDGMGSLQIVSALLTILTIAPPAGWCIYGAIHANDDGHCRIKTVADFVITAPYALGCNLFKNRFDIKVN